MDLLNTNSRYMINKSLDYLWEKQRVISTNIANAETPGYKAKYVTFEDELRRNLDNVSSDLASPGAKQKIRDAVDATQMRVHETKGHTLKADGNNVNIDAENIELTRTQLQYQALIDALVKDQRMKTVITSR